MWWLLKKIGMFKCSLLDMSISIFHIFNLVNWMYIVNLAGLYDEPESDSTIVYAIVVTYIVNVLFFGLYI